MWIFEHLISYGNRFAQLTTESARHVLCQLSKKLSFSKYPLNNDKDMEYLQFEI